VSLAMILRPIAYRPIGDDVERETFNKPSLSQDVFCIFGTSPSLDQIFQQQQNPLAILFLSSKDLPPKNRSHRHPTKPITPI